MFFESQSSEPLFPPLAMPCSFMGDLVPLSPSQTLHSQGLCCPTVSLQPLSHSRLL